MTLGKCPLKFTLREEKNQWRKLCWKKELDCFILFHPAQVKESPFAFLKAPSRQGMPKRERKKERYRTGLRLNCLPQAAKVELLEECFFYTHTIIWKRGNEPRCATVVGKLYSNRNQKPILPLRERTHLTTTTT